MASIRRINFTKEGFRKLEQELIDLRKNRPAAVKELVRARELGDLSENGLYTAAKARLRSMDSRMARIEQMIKLADIQDAPKDAVGIGSTVLVMQNGKEIQYQIVGDFEADPIEKKISQKSPIGHALLGKKVGESTSLTTPAGTQTLEIIKII